MTFNEALREYAQFCAEQRKPLNITEFMDWYLLGIVPNMGLEIK